MSTVLSSTRQEAARAVTDVRALFGFRLAGLRGRARHAAPVALAVLALLSVAAMVVPAFCSFPGIERGEVLALLPAGYVSMLVISVVSAAASGGGRELLPRDQAVAFPVSSTTDHLGAFAMVPLNITWLLQTWTLLGATSYAVGPRPALPAALLPVLAWVVAASAVAQLLAWVVEWVRRGPHGRLLVRGGTVLAALAFGTLVASERLGSVLDHSPTRVISTWVLDPGAGRWASWLLGVVVLLAVTAGALVLGAATAAAVARRPARDELRIETASRPARANPASDIVGLLRTDRAGIWRSVPMRRGLVMLVAFPALVAVAGTFTWDMLAILPGLVAAGGALLFGVNSWCLDGRGALWRESLPVSPRLVFLARVLVLVEVLVVATVATLLVASLRAGLPNLDQLVAVTCAAVVVIVQVVATSLRWSVRRPFAVNLRSSRATPAPPLTMVDYSARLALATTLTGLLFNVTAVLGWSWSVLLAVPFLVWSGVKLRRTTNLWCDPQARSRVVVTVAS